MRCVPAGDLATGVVMLINTKSRHIVPTRIHANIHAYRAHISQINKNAIKDGSSWYKAFLDDDFYDHFLTMPPGIPLLFHAVQLLIVCALLFHVW